MKGFKLIRRRQEPENLYLMVSTGGGTVQFKLPNIEVAQQLGLDPNNFEEWYDTEMKYYAGELTRPEQILSVYQNEKQIKIGNKFYDPKTMQEIAYNPNRDYEELPSGMLQAFPTGGTPFSTIASGRPVEGETDFMKFHKEMKERGYSPQEINQKYVEELKKKYPERYPVSTPVVPSGSGGSGSQTPSPVGTVGTWVDFMTGQGYSGAKRNANDFVYGSGGQSSGSQGGGSSQITIPSGATLSGLASQYGVTVEQLLALNPQITNPNLIYAGQPLNIPGGSSGSGGGSGSSGGGTGTEGGTGFESTGNAVLDQLLLNLNQYLDKLAKQGQVVNPEVEITPEKMAEFMSQAEREIDPYYSSQMRLAKEGLLRTAGYTTQQIADYEKTSEETYGKTLGTYQENLAGTGWGYSGKRVEGERTLAEATQRDIEAKRREASYTMGTNARNFAQLWGTQNLDTSNISSAPMVRAGEKSFEWGSGTTPLYQLSDDVYSGLVGEKQWEQQAAKKTRASELESAWRESEELKKWRELNLT